MQIASTTDHHYKLVLIESLNLYKTEGVSVLTGKRATHIYDLTRDMYTNHCIVAEPSYGHFASRKILLISLLLSYSRKYIMQTMKGCLIYPKIFILVLKVSYNLYKMANSSSDRCQHQ